MNKQELITAIHDELPNPAVLTKADIARVLDAQATVVRRALDARESDAGAEAWVSLPGLGKLVTHIRAERTGRNPQTGEAITIPEARVVKFRPGQELAEAVA